MKFFFFILAGLLISQVCSQGILEIIDRENKEVIVGVQVIVTNENGEEFGVTDENGKFKFSLALPVTYQISHVSYIGLNGKLTDKNSVVTLSPKETRLEDVVITGQFSPVSAKNSVYNVRSISQERLQSQKATSLENILANELNIRFSRDNATGRSGASLQGLGGQYVKILIDGVPMVGRGGTGNDIDLNQFDIQTIERVEIVEGPMAVNYGADALAGVINIITKKDIQSKVDINLTLLEESIGSEYSLFNEGIHSPSLSMGYKISPRLYTQVSSRLFKYGGWIGNGDNSNRDWYPKTQYFGGFLTRYSLDKLDVFYRLDYLDETLLNRGPVEDSNPLIDPFSLDEEYLTKRWIHQIQADADLSFAISNTAISYSDYTRTVREFTRNIVTNTETLTGDNGQDTTSYTSFFVRQTFNQMFKGEYGSLQLGFDGNFENGGGTRLNEGEKSLNDMGLFLSAEMLFGKLKARPGLRLSKNSVFKTAPTASVNFSYQMSEATTMRWSYGRGFRAPSLTELYYEFIDANHNIIGNPELEPEYSNNVNLGITHELTAIPISIGFGSFYNSVDNMIRTVADADNPQVTTYTNIDNFQTAGANLSVSYSKNKLSVESGISRIGRYQQLEESNDVPAFVFSTEVNTRISYESILNSGIDAALFYKYTGRNKDYQLEEGEPVLNGIPGFHMIDLNFSKNFKEILSASIGARNLLNITNLQNTSQGGAHGGGSQSPISAGRSFFIQINYSFKH